MFDGADTVVLYEELAFQDVLPVVWRQMPNPADRDMAAGFTERNLQVLQAWDAMDEHGRSTSRTRTRPTPPTSCAWTSRSICCWTWWGKFLPPTGPVRPPCPCASMPWAACGAAPPLCPKPVSRAWRKFTCMTASRSRLRLPGRVTNVTPDGQVKVRFAPVGESVADLIEKLAFRRHRRQIAGSRQPRRDWYNVVAQPLIASRSDAASALLAQSQRL